MIFLGISRDGSHRVRFVHDFRGWGSSYEVFVQNFRGWGSSCEVLTRISGDGAPPVRFCLGYAHVGISVLRSEGYRDFSGTQ